MEYIKPKDIINAFAKYRPGDEVIIIRDLQAGSTTLSAPINAVVSDVKFISKKAEKQIPKYNVRDVNRLKIDPDLLIYTVRIPQTKLTYRLYGHALIPRTDSTECFGQGDCNGMYRSKHRRFTRFIKDRRHRRLVKSSLMALLSAVLCIWLAIMTFRTNTMIEDIFLSIIYIVATAGIFAVCNRHIERIHLK